MRTECESGAVPVFLRDRLMESCDDDSELALEVLIDFRESAVNRLAGMASAIASADPVLVRLEAHSLKGSARTVGAESLAEVCAQLENIGDSGDLFNAPILLTEAGVRFHTLSYALADYIAEN